LNDDQNVDGFNAPINPALVPDQWQPRDYPYSTQKTVAPDWPSLSAHKALSALDQYTRRIDLPDGMFIGFISTVSNPGIDLLDLGDVQTLRPCRRSCKS